MARSYSIFTSILTSLFTALAALALSSGCAAEPSGSADTGVDAAASDAARFDAARACADAASCSDGLYCNGEETCSAAGMCVPGTPPSCDDGVACTTDGCVESRRACENVPPDADHDGVADAACHDAGGVALGTDCDDHDATRHPGTMEVCDALGHDEDCNPLTYGAIDVDGDGHNDAACCNTGGACGDDCNDMLMGVHPGSPEVCNNVDDDCDHLVDDIIGGTVICHAGQTRACHNASCGTDGLEACADTCLGFDGRCVATEICNGCDDDADGAPDNGFACARGTSTSCTVPVCGTTGTEVCGSACTYGTCVAPEACNYCDDNGSGNFFEERPLAVNTASFNLSNCVSGAYSLYGPGTACGTTPSGSMGFDLWATLLDGSANDQAGALWFDPGGWTQGWGPTEVTVDLEVTAVTAGGGAEIPLGGWAVIIGHGGTLGLGTPRNRGIPTTVTGVAASWFWSTYDSCYMPTAPPNSNDSVRFTPIRGSGIGSVRAIGSAMDSGCFSGEGISGGAIDFDGVATGTVTQRLQLRYTPDDPTTSATNEEEVRIIASSPAGSAGATITYTYVPSNDLPIGTTPLRIGITAGTFTQSGFTSGGPPPTLVFGVPVRARAHIFNQQNHSLGPPTFTYSIPTTRAGLCP